MFKLFKKKTEVERLNDQYKKLLKESHQLSSSSRSASDAKLVQAEQILKKIDLVKMEISS